MFTYNQNAYLFLFYHPHSSNESSKVTMIIQDLVRTLWRLATIKSILKMFDGDICSRSISQNQ